MAKTILIIDDSTAVRQLSYILLEKAGYEVLEAQDGKDALHKLDGRKIDLIICDLNMPNMDGATFVKKAKKIAEYQFTPIIMLTTESSVSKKLEGKVEDAKAWIVKPFQPAQLLVAVSNLVQT